MGIKRILDAQGISGDCLWNFWFPRTQSENHWPKLKRFAGDSGSFEVDAHLLTFNGESVFDSGVGGCDSEKRSNVADGVYLGNHVCV